MSSDVIRMSLRPRRADKGVFKVGDVVEVTYRNGIELGTLLSKVNSDRWIVKYKNNNLHEMQVSQSAFGRLLKRCSSDEESVGEKRKRSLRDKRARDRRSAIDSMNRKGTSRRGKKRKKPTANEEEKSMEKSIVLNKNAEEESIDNSGIKSSKDSDRSVRSGRSGRSNRSWSRKAMKTENSTETPPLSTGTIQPIKKDEPKLSAREKRLRMRREAAGEGADEEHHTTSKSKRDRIKNTNIPSKEKEEVVKVKMNTGTLYMYRGSNPRAVFIRRY